MFKNSLKKITAILVHRMYCLSHEGASSANPIRAHPIPTRSSENSGQGTLLPADRLLSALHTLEPA